MSRNRARRWVAVTALTPTLLLPVTLFGASSSFQAAPQAPQGKTDLRELGVTGNLPRARKPSQDLLRQAGDPNELASGSGRSLDLPSGKLGIPDTVLNAYHRAADLTDERNPGCGLHWSVLASIGRIESGHARSGSVDVLGTTSRAILGPRLSGGPGVAAIPDTDGGALDGDPVWDRAVGPMQFIPSTWRKFAVDGKGDGVASPHNVYDATAAAGQYLCSGGGDLRNPRDLAAAVFRYNHSERYVRTVLIWATAYANGALPTPSELSPAVDDVLAGERLPEGPAVLAMPEEPAPETPPAPSAEQPPPTESAAPSTQPGELPPIAGGALPHEPGEASVPEPTPPNLTPSPSPTEPGPTQPGPTQPGASEPPPSDAKPGTPTETRPPESKPETQAPSTQPAEPAPGAPSSEAPPPEASPAPAPEPKPETPAPAAPPSENRPPEAKPAPPQPENPASEAKPGTPPAGSPAPPAPETPPEPASGARPTPPSVTEPPTTLPETGDPAPARIESLGTCDPAVLGRGEFSPSQPPQGTEIQPGTTDPTTLAPGQEVYVSTGTPGVIGTCTTGIPTSPR
ncbi:lytic murein transglycosylase [Saccharopolyspora sp. NPDC002376]